LAEVAYLEPSTHCWAGMGRAVFWPQLMPVPGSLWRRFWKPNGDLTFLNN
jgi:hypothetical protein